MPEELSALTQLSYLDLDQNQIVRIPLFVQNFTKLTEFYCNNETIQTI
jgi:Leucine-rich repeat (LRR) protein